MLDADILYLVSHFSNFLILCTMFDVAAEVSGCCDVIVNSFVYERTFMMMFAEVLEGYIGRV